jgi:hypothetical protein
VVTTLSYTIAVRLSAASGSLLGSTFTSLAEPPRKPSDIPLKLYIYRPALVEQVEYTVSAWVLSSRGLDGLGGPNRRGARTGGNVLAVPAKFNGLEGNFVVFKEQRAMK